MKKFGKNIRKLRELRNLTQQHMAKELEMTQGNYARIENEEINISHARLQKISEILNYSIEFIENFDVSKINDLAITSKREAEVYQMQISPELKQLYESRIAGLEKEIEELKRENQSLKLNSFAEQ